MSDYDTHDPKGWCGDPSRGAALGRPTIKGEPEGKITVRRSPLDRQGYDRNGTYFGLGDKLFWIADEGGSVDFVTRSYFAETLARSLRRKYPGSEVVIGDPLSLPCWGYGSEVCPDGAEAAHVDQPEGPFGDQCEACYERETYEDRVWESDKFPPEPRKEVDDA
jgi:hypothetical protein